MSKNRQQRRILRGPTVPVPAIVATDPVAVTARAPVSAPEFPGLDEATPLIYDQLLAETRPSLSEAEAQAMIAEGFESWDLDEIAPLPIESLIKDLKAQVGEGMAWVIESEAGRAVLADRLTKNLGEVDNDEQPDDGPTGDADLADGPARPALVVSDGDHSPGPAQEG